MVCNIYVLLVGIDQYGGGISLLNGCVNDVKTTEAYLRDRISEERLHILSLFNQQATYQAVIDGFKQHLSQATQDDTVLFYYAGHGSQETTPEALWHLEPDRLDETLVCYDSRMENGYDLADKELSYLISQIAINNPHIVVILDCCHSGSGTRDIFQEIGVRHAPKDDRGPRPLESFVFARDNQQDFDQWGSNPENLSGWKLATGNHILLAACRSHETAKEYNADGQPRGSFSYFLLDTLQRATGALTYNDLFFATNALIRGNVAAQSPVLETIGADPNQAFLGEGVINDRVPYFFVNFNYKTSKWVMNGGAVHGIPKPTPNETTLLALFPAEESDPERLRQLINAREAKIKRVEIQQSEVEIDGVENLDRNARFKAIIVSLPLKRLNVVLQGEAETDNPAITLARQALQNAGPRGEQPSLYIQELAASIDTNAPNAQADLCLLARNGQYIITRLLDGQALTAPVPEQPGAGYTLENASKAIQYLEHIARWNCVLKLHNPSPGQLKSNAVKLDIIQYGNEATPLTQSSSGHEVSEIRLQYEPEGEEGELISPTIKVKLTNNSSKTIYCALLELSENFAVSNFSFPEGTVRLQPGEEVEGDWLDIEVPDSLWQSGTTERTDVLKLIVSTADFDARLSHQDALDAPTRSWETRALAGSVSDNAFNRLMSRIYAREAKLSTRGYADDWFAKEISIVVVRPQGAQEVDTEEAVSLGQGVELQPHPHLKAKVSLTSVPAASRDLGNWILPPILQTDSEVFQPFQFKTSRGSDPGLSSLELSEIDPNTLESVTPEEPLLLTVEAPLREGEFLLPIAYDGEFFLPLGRGKRTEAGNTEIIIERLPDPMSDRKRSLHGSIRIFFQKVLSNALGLKDEYPILAIAEVSEDEKVEYTKKLDTIKDKVAKAEKIVLFVHGIIGDTKSMAGSMQRAKVGLNGEQRPLKELYDLILTFDYENINTKIEETAERLKQRLAEVGLGANHGKTLHIVAHSMGGLVSRYFIEKLDGKQVVSHLVMLGTPNDGSPWPNVQKLATAALTFGLNSLSTVALPVKILGSLFSAIELIDETLDQMERGSTLLKALENTDDPGVPYTIIAGTESVMPAALNSGQIERLMRKLFRGSVNWVFLNQLNDIAATVDSIKSVSEKRSPAPIKQEIQCNHLIYFTHETGLDCLKNALQQALPPQ